MKKNQTMIFLVNYLLFMTIRDNENMATILKATLYVSSILNDMIRRRLMFYKFGKPQTFVKLLVSFNIEIIQIQFDKEVFIR
jgi:hypothetical protein